MTDVTRADVAQRLAGCQEWEPPLQIGRDIVVNAGGSAAFINARPTADRRFLVEQMAVLELIGGCAPENGANKRLT